MTGFSGYELGPIVIFLPLFWAVLAVLVVLWFTLPFAVFGIKRRLDRMIDLLEAQGRSGGAEHPNRSTDPSGAAARIFEEVRRELIQARADVSEEGRVPGRASFFLTSGARRIGWAELNLRGDRVELELDLEGLAPALRGDDALARIQAALARKPGIRLLTGQKRHQATVQIEPEGETRVRELAALLKTRILDVLPS
jgi:hypothetical protein